MIYALLIGMKSELIRLSRKSDMDEITLDKTLDFFVKELLEFIHPAEVEDLDEYKHKLLSDFDTYYVDIVKGFTPVLVKIPYTAKNIHAICMDIFKLRGQDLNL